MNIPKSLQDVLLVGVSALALSCSAPMKNVESGQKPQDRIDNIIKIAREKCGISHNLEHSLLHFYEPTVTFTNADNDGKLAEPERAECVTQAILSQGCGVETKGHTDALDFLRAAGEFKATGAIKTSPPVHVDAITAYCCPKQGQK